MCAVIPLFLAAFVSAADSFCLPFPTVWLAQVGAFHADQRRLTNLKAMRAF